MPGALDDVPEPRHKEPAPEAKVYASGVAFDPGNALVFDHGTHVAGTIGGCVIELDDGTIKDTVSGVAPGANLFDSNVFPGFGAGLVAFGGSAFSHDIAAALEDSVIDGMHVANMSLGGDQQGPNDFLEQATNATVDAGVVVVTSAGDDALACDAADDVEAVEGTVTLIERGECSFTTKVRNAQTAGAVGVVVYNNVAGPPIGMAHDGTDPFPEIPAVMVSQSDGIEILDNLPAATTIEGPPEEVTDGIQEDVLAGFSSRGPTAHGARVKPDVTLDPVFVGFGEWTGNKPVTASQTVTVTNVSEHAVSCEVGVDPDGSVTVTVSPDEFSVIPGARSSFTVDLDAGRSNQTPSGDDAEITVGCGDTDLQAPWWVRIDRQARP